MRWTIVGMIVGIAATLRLSGAVTTGSLVLDQADLERRRKAGRPIKTTHIGGVVIKSDVTPDLATKVIWNLRIFGGLVAPKEVMKALPGRVKITGGIDLH